MTPNLCACSLFSRCITGPIAWEGEEGVVGGGAGGEGGGTTVEEQKEEREGGGRWWWRKRRSKKSRRLIKTLTTPKTHTDSSMLTRLSLRLTACFAVQREHILEQQHALQRGEYRVFEFARMSLILTRGFGFMKLMK